MSYSFTGASIPVDAKTFSVDQIQNVSTMVVPQLSSTLTDALKDRFSRQTRLSQIREDGDMSFAGEITNYVSSPIAVTGDEYASMNRLTVTVKIRFTNKFKPEESFDKSFSAYEDYDSNKLMQEVEPVLIPQIVEKLVEDIFNASVSNW
ncbi:MAG: LptE family protein [Rikenellaceae bacterium]